MTVTDGRQPSQNGPRVVGDDGSIPAPILAALHRQVSLDNPLLSSIPFSSYRDGQVKAVEEVMAAYESGVKVVILDAPTGVGKSLIAETVRRMLRTAGLYTATTKSLQDQLQRDFPYAKVLKGRGNYATELQPDAFHPDTPAMSISCGDCTWSKASPRCGLCNTKRSCPYEVAKGLALGADLAVVNTAYFLTEANGPGRFGNRPFTIIDEADTLENQLMTYVSVEITERRMRQYGLGPVRRVTVPSSWGEWLGEAIPTLDEFRSRLDRQSSEVKAVKEAKYLDSIYEKLSRIQSGLEDGNWVYTGRGNEVSFRPARVDGIAGNYLWKHSDRWLLMSGTVISSQEMMESLGYTDSYHTVSVPSTFPVANRKVYALGVADASKKGLDNGSGAELSSVCQAIAVRHPDERILVHSVSYKLSAELYDSVNERDRRVFTHVDASGRERALNGYKMEAGSILISPSMDRGVDLPGDLCRVQVICKVPYLNLGDRQVSARLHTRGGQGWYTVAAIRTLIQMTGRGVRSEDDYAITYILDSGFDRLYGKYRHLFPTYWRDAVVTGKDLVGIHG